MSTLNSTIPNPVLDIEMFQQTMIAVLTLLDNDAPKGEIIPIVERLTFTLEEHSIVKAVNEHALELTSNPPQTREASVVGRVASSV